MVSSTLEIGKPIAISKRRAKRRRLPLPYPPEVRINRHAREFWRHAVESLAEMGILERADIGMLTDYAIARARLRELESRPTEEIDWKTVNLIRYYSTVAFSRAQALGLAPAARSRLGKSKLGSTPPTDPHGLLDV